MPPATAQLSERDAARLEALLAGNVEAQRFYLTCVRLDGCLRREFGHRSQEPAPIPPIILDSLPRSALPLFTLHSPVGGFLFSYSIATLILRTRVVGRLGVEDSRRSTYRPRRPVAGYAGRRVGIGVAVRRPNHRRSRLPVGRRGDRPAIRPTGRRPCPLGPQILRCLGVHGNHLRHRGQGYSPGAVAGMKWNRPAAASSRWASSRQGGEEVGGRRARGESAEIRNPKSQIRNLLSSPIPHP